MLQMNISNKQELLKLIQKANIRRVVAKDIHKPEDLNEVKKSGLEMLRDKKSITAILVAE